MTGPHLLLVALCPPPLVNVVCERPLTAVYCPDCPKLQIRLMSLAADISLNYLSRRHSCLQVLEMHRVRRINIALVILILSHVLQVIHFCFAGKKVGHPIEICIFSTATYILSICLYIRKGAKKLGRSSRKFVDFSECMNFIWPIKKQISNLFVILVVQIWFELEIKAFSLSF